jgi:hypothetical protein
VAHFWEQNSNSISTSVYSTPPTFIIHPTPGLFIVQPGQKSHTIISSTEQDSCFNNLALRAYQSAFLESYKKLTLSPTQALRRHSAVEKMASSGLLATTNCRQSFHSLATTTMPSDYGVYPLQRTRPVTMASGPASPLMRMSPSPKPFVQNFHNSQQETQTPSTSAESSPIKCKSPPKTLTGTPSTGVSIPIEKLFGASKLTFPDDTSSSEVNTCCQTPCSSKEAFHAASFDLTYESGMPSRANNGTHSWPLRLKDATEIERKGAFQQLYELFKSIYQTIGGYRDINLNADLFWIRAQIQTSLGWLWKVRVKKDK